MLLEGPRGLTDDHFGIKTTPAWYSMSGTCSDFCTVPLCLTRTFFWTGTWLVLWSLLVLTGYIYDWRCLVSDTEGRSEWLPSWEAGRKPRSDPCRDSDATQPEQSSTLPAHSFCSIWPVQRGLFPQGKLHSAVSLHVFPPGGSSPDIIYIHWLVRDREQKAVWCSSHSPTIITVGFCLA